MTSEALASLTATYTDSEGEEDMEEEQTTPEKSHSPSPLLKSNSNSPMPPSINVTILSAPSTPKPVKRLVSYNDDEIYDDEMSSAVIDRTIPTTETNVPVAKPVIPEDDDVSLPLIPTGKCPPELQEKISSLYNKMIDEGKDMNKVIQERKSFRNPSIYEKLIQFCNINELDTNYPPEIYDPLRWGKESYCEELAKVQESEMDKREKDRKEKLSKIDFTTGLVIKRAETEDDSKKRKSKWDQAAPNTSSVNMVVKPAGLVQAALTSSVTGNKGTLSAFGCIPKKAKV